METSAIWTDDGHLGSEAACAFADGELVSTEAATHVAACQRCSHAVGLAALRAAELDQLLGALRLDQVERALLAPGHQRRRPRALAVAMAASVALAAFVGGRLSAGPGAPIVGPSAPSSVVRAEVSVPRLRLGRARDGEVLSHQEPPRLRLAILQATTGWSPDPSPSETGCDDGRKPR